ncbi:MAG: PilZ domain-containing protein [Myxococcota bacterium]
MLIPVGEDVAVPVTVVALGDEPEIWTAVVRRLEVDSMRIRITTPGAAPRLGLRLIVNAGERTKLPGRVLSIEPDGELVASRDQAHATDDRAAPRVISRTELRWRETTRDRAEADPWLRGGDDPGGFTTFRGGASLSMSGVRFPCRGPLPAIDAQLLIALSLQGEEYRALGVVRRVDPEGADPAIGVEFLELPESTFDALSEFTLRNL